MTWTLPLTAGLYVLGLLHSFLGFYSNRLIFVYVALGMVGCGFIGHTLFLIVLALERRHFPITSLPESAAQHLATEILSRGGKGILNSLPQPAHHE